MLLRRHIRAAGSGGDGLLCFEPFEGLPCSFASTATRHNISEPHGSSGGGVRLRVAHYTLNVPTLGAAPIPIPDKE